MPILVDKYLEWSQNEATIVLKLPLKDVSICIVDVMSTSLYLKISYPPYLYEAFLLNEVIPSQTKITIGDGMIILMLTKCSKTIWKSIKNYTSLDKEAIKTIRSGALEEYRKMVEEEKKKTLQLKETQKREAVAKQLEFENQFKTLITNEKNETIEQYEEEIEIIKTKEFSLSEQHKNNNHNTNTTTTTINNNNNNNNNNKSNYNRMYGNNNNTSILHKNKFYQHFKLSSTLFSSVQSNSKIFYEEQHIPYVRATNAVIKCKFTNRVLPTPERESQKQEEEEWLAGIAAERRYVENNTNSNQSDGAINNTEHDDSINDTETHNPQWLKDKGDAYCHNGDFDSAITAYSAALKLTTKLPTLYSNRAVCYLKQCLYERCIEDCTSALELLMPVIEINKNIRANVFCRRGSSWLYLYQYQKALDDYKQALQITPNNKNLENDLKQIADFINST